MEFEEDDGGGGGKLESVTGLCKEELLVAELDELDAALVDKLVNDAEYVVREYVTLSEIEKEVIHHKIEREPAVRHL